MFRELSAATLGLTMGMATVLVPMVQAQNAQETPVENINETNTVPTGQTTTLVEGVDWRWFLPLLIIIPLILLVIGSGEDTQGHTRYYRRQRLAGTKGGRARRDADQTSDYEEYIEDEELL
jgi:hypothetical protein